MSKVRKKVGLRLQRDCGFEEGRLRLRRARGKVIQPESRDVDDVVTETRIVSYVHDAMEEYEPDAVTSCPFVIVTESGLHLARYRTFWLAVTYAKRWARVAGNACELRIEMLYG